MFRCLILGCVIATLVLSSSACAADKTPNWISSGDGLIVAQIGDSNSWAAYSKYSGKWVTHTFPKNVTPIPFIPVTVNGLVAFELRGEEITEVVAVDRQGNWQVQKLTKAATEKCSPIVEMNVAAYKIGNRTYAFSGLMGLWDSIAHASVPAVTEDTVMLVASGNIAMFSAQTGKWAESPNLSRQP